ncbi:helix-turn-helix domain-containing protein [Virgibacillus sp. MG-45]|uniref:helix-turn-helix domain-containing protein n=1 Tax=Virgibacillus sp. MG-45 TaxID=3102791 RepID=UPI002ED8760E
MTTFDRLKKLCDEQKISFVELEEKLGFGRNSLYNWKKKTPNGASLKKVADYFNVSVDYLLGRTDKKYLEDTDTIAAHHDGEEWTEEELEEIKRFKEFVKLKRKQQGD